MVDLILIPRRPNVAVVVLSHIGYSGLWELAKRKGASVCVLKPHTSDAELDKAIQRAMACMGHRPKEDRHRPI